MGETLQNIQDKRFYFILECLDDIVKLSTCLDLGKVLYMLEFLH